jgi:hypothetical protein
MSFLARMARQKELGSRRTSLEEAIEINALSLENVAAMKDTLLTEGMQMYVHQLRQDLKNKGAKLEELAINPDENRFQLAYYGAVCATIRKQLAWMQGIVGRGRNLIEEQNRLRDAAKNTEQEGAM